MPKLTPYLWFDTGPRRPPSFLLRGLPRLRSDKRDDPARHPQWRVRRRLFSDVGQDFMAISAGPLFTINPSISVMVSTWP